MSEPGRNPRPGEPKYDEGRCAGVHPGATALELY